jgi:hypothetical protein
MIVDRCNLLLFFATKATNLQEQNLFFNRTIVHFWNRLWHRATTLPAKSDDIRHILER